ncbi:unnamed protein product [Closterium sp. NIES-54]
MAPALLPRYLVLAKCSLLMYRRDPTLVKNEEPVSSGVLTPQLAVEDCGREVYADGRALHSFRVYNKAMPDQGGKALHAIRVYNKAMPDQGGKVRRLGRGG